METFAPKLSLYDIISMLIPGGIILFIMGLYCPCLSPCNLCTLTGDNSIAFAIFIFFPLAYMIGIANHIFASILWGAFRNNPSLISFCLLRVVNGEFESTPNLDKLLTKPKVDNCTVLTHCVQHCFLCGILMVVVASIIAVILSILSLCCAWIVLAVFLIILYLVNLYIKCCSNNSIERSLVLEKYYEAYYYVQQNSQNKDVPVIEGQVAFLQSMVVPISLLATMQGSAASSMNCGIRLLIFMVYIGIFPIVYQRIKKIHRRVWEDYEFLKRNK